MGHLQKDASPIAGVRLAAARPAVFQVQQDLERLLDDRVRLPRLEINDKAHATGIVFITGVVQALPGRNRRLGHLARLLVSVNGGRAASSSLGSFWQDSPDLLCSLPPGSWSG